MYKEIQAIHIENKPQGAILRVLVPSGIDDIDLDRFAADGIIKGGMRIDDGRSISSEQRRKAYAIIRDMSDWNGDLPEYLKEDMKYLYIEKTGSDYFSLSNCDMTTARLFINHLIDFAFEWNIPMRDTVINRTDDINAAIYSSLKHKRCIVCGNDGEIHHVDAIGAGRDRTKVDDRYMRKLCLCRVHHSEAHQIGMAAFEELHHVYGIIFNE